MVFHRHPAVPPYRTYGKGSPWPLLPPSGWTYTPDRCRRAPSTRSRGRSRRGPSGPTPPRSPGGSWASRSRRRSTGAGRRASRCAASCARWASTAPRAPSRGCWDPRQGGAQERSARRGVSSPPARHPQHRRGVGAARRGLGGVLQQVPGRADKIPSGEAHASTHRRDALKSFYGRPRGRARQQRLQRRFETRVPDGELKCGSARRHTDLMPRHRARGY